MENDKKITELIESALECDDYDFRINFLVGGMMSAESNDTPEIIQAVQEKKGTFRICRNQ